MLWKDLGAMISPRSLLEMTLVIYEEVEVANINHTRLTGEVGSCLSLEQKNRGEYVRDDAFYDGNPWGHWDEDPHCTTKMNSYLMCPIRMEGSWLTEGKTKRLLKFLV
jgi:hypothetical protein